MELTGQGSILEKLHWRAILQRADIIAALGLVGILMIMIIPPAHPLLLESFPFK